MSVLLSQNVPFSQMHRSLARTRACTAPFRGPVSLPELVYLEPDTGVLLLRDRRGLTLVRAQALLEARQPRQSASGLPVGAG